MDLALKGSSILTNLKTITYQAVRHKGIPKAYRLNWKPIPPKPQRKSYYMQYETRNWNYPLLNYQKSLAAKNSEPQAPPSQMHVVSRCKSLFGQTKDCKALCEHFGIEDKLHSQVLIANTHTNNELLMQIKHLIRVKPLSLPDGLPLTQSDLWNTQLRTDGSLRVIKSLPPADTGENRTRLMQGITVVNKNKQQVVSLGILREYVKTKYTWKYNEDSKEFPYRPKITN